MESTRSRRIYTEYEECRTSPGQSSFLTIFLQLYYIRKMFCSLHESSILCHFWADQYMNQQEKLPTVSIFAGPTHPPIDQCISRSKHGFARLDQRLRQPDVKRRQHKYLLVFQLQILGVCNGYIRKMAERYYLYLSTCPLEVDIADLPQPWPTSPETLWWASYFNLAKLMIWSYSI